MSLTSPILPGFTDLSQLLQNVEKRYTEKIEQQAKEIQQLKDEIHTLQTQLNNKDSQQYDVVDADHISLNEMTNILDEIDEIEQKYDEIEEKKNDIVIGYEEDEDEEEEHKEQTSQFWSYVDKKLKEGDIEYIKDIVRKKEIKMDDVNVKGRNLLMLSTSYASFELVSMCINLGADLDKQDSDKKTALKIAQESGYPDIEELILMNLLKTELGQRIENTTKDLLKKKAINDNFKRILNELFSQLQHGYGAVHADIDDDDVDEKYAPASSPRIEAVSHRFLSEMTTVYKKEVLDTLMRVTLKSIENKTAFSDDILYIAFLYEMDEGKSPTDTMIYRMIKKIILNILSDTKNKINWFWLKTYILSSSIWFIKLDPNDSKSESNFLYYNLFEWVEKESMKQAQILSEPMREIENRDISNWNRLVHYNIETNWKCLHGKVRQDRLDEGLTAEYSKSELTQNISLGGTFNPIIHYDLSQYLTKLILICHECDDQFQHDMQTIFNVNKETKENKKLGLLYLRGPVKKLDRCYSKCQSDYRNEEFPTAAHVLDIIRCSLIFDDVSCMHIFFFLRNVSMYKII